MKRYSIYKHPSKGIEAIKSGFSWPAFLFGAIWLILKKLWVLTALWISAFILLILIATLTYGTSSVFINTIVFMGNIILLLLPGLKGNNWVINSLKRNGYVYINTIEAESPEAAIDQTAKDA